MSNGPIIWSIDQDGTPFLGELYHDDVRESVLHCMTIDDESGRQLLCPRVESQSECQPKVAVYMSSFTLGR